MSNGIVQPTKVGEINYLKPRETNVSSTLSFKNEFMETNGQFGSIV